MGYRLDGPRLEVSGEEVLSFGLVAGALQVPAGGMPVLLMADHQTAGGYPVVATGASAWMPVAAELAPCDKVQLAEKSLEAGREGRVGQAEAPVYLTQ